MFKDAEELKSFILWCRENTVKSVTLDGVSFELSEISFLPKSDASQILPEEKSKELSEEELLFLSSN